MHLKSNLIYFANKQYKVRGVGYCRMMPTPQVPFTCQPTQLKQILVRMFPDGHTILNHRFHWDFPAELQPLDKLPQVNQSQSRDFGVQHCVLECFQIHSGCYIRRLYSMIQPKSKLKAEINSIYLLSSLPLTKAIVTLFTRPLTELGFMLVCLFICLFVSNSANQAKQELNLHFSL